LSDAPCTVVDFTSYIMAAPADTRSVLGDLANKMTTTGSAKPLVVKAIATEAAQPAPAADTSTSSDQQLAEPLLDENRER
jgi:hypothetical protein